MVNRTTSFSIGEIELLQNKNKMKHYIEFTVKSKVYVTGKGTAGISGFFYQ